MCVKIKKIITIKMEVYAKEKDKFNKPHYENERLNTKEERMEKLNVNLEQTANYMIQLFYQTGQKYSCTRTKIGKLLSIVAFVYAKKDRQIFNEVIYKYGDCGTTINELTATVDRDVYLQCDYQDDKNYIECEFDVSVPIPDKHKETDRISEEVKLIVQKVFRNFGAYSAYDLGQLICPIINCKNMVGINDDVNLFQLFMSKYDDFAVLEDVNDKLLNYLFEYDYKGNN